jgi:transcriptional regulator with XRE-family HTH domain
VTRFRELAGAALRRRRNAQGRTLREVADAAGVSLTYLSEVERGRKEPSSEVLEAVCTALGVLLSDVLFEVAHTLVRLEAAESGVPVGFLPREPAPAPAEAAVTVTVPAPLPEPVPVAAEPVAAGVLDFTAFAARRTA